MAVYTSKILVSGLQFPEGPRWHEGRLWFSDIFAQTVYSLGADGGDLRPEAVLDQRPSGLGWLPDGRLLMVSMRDHRLLRRETDGSITDVADLSTTLGEGGEANDMVTDAVGRCYVGSTSRSTRLALVTPDGQVRATGEEMVAPNGGTFLDGGRVLVIAQPRARRLVAYDVLADGTLTKFRVWAQFETLQPDGICADAEGAIWIGAVNQQHFARIREGGEVLDAIPVPGKATVAPALGGPDGRMLYLCTSILEGGTFKSGKSVGWIEAATVAVPAP